MAARTWLVRSGLRISAAISAWLTASHPNSEVKQVRAGVVLRWGTTREGPVLRFFFRFAEGAAALLSFFSFLAHLGPAGLYGGVGVSVAGLRDPRSLGKAEGLFSFGVLVASCGCLATGNTGKVGVNPDERSPSAVPAPLLRYLLIRHLETDHRFDGQQLRLHPSLADAGVTVPEP